MGLARTQTSLMASIQGALSIPWTGTCLQKCKIMNFVVLYLQAGDDFVTVATGN